MKCVACGFDPDIQVTKSWHVTLEASLPSQNQIGANIGKRARAGWIYRKIKSGLNDALDVALGTTPVPAAAGYRRIWITREFGKRKRNYDYANLVGGAKPLVDLLIDHNLILDDRIADMEAYYSQVKSPDGVDRIHLLIEELDLS